MIELKVKFDKNISLKEFDNKIPGLVNNFPSEISVLIKVSVKKDFFEAILLENPNKYAAKRWEWDLNDVEYYN